MPSILMEVESLRLCNLSGTQLTSVNLTRAYTSCAQLEASCSCHASAASAPLSSSSCMAGCMALSWLAGRILPGAATSRHSQARHAAALRWCLGWCRRMQTFKEFMLQLPEEVMPDEAKGAYRQYQAEFWGSEIRADFELHKGEQWWVLPGMWAAHGLWSAWG